MSPCFHREPGFRASARADFCFRKAHEGRDRCGTRPYLLYPSGLPAAPLRAVGSPALDPQLLERLAAISRLHLPAALLQAAGVWWPLLPGQSAPGRESRCLTSHMQPSAHSRSSSVLLCILSGISLTSSVCYPHDCGQGSNPAGSQSPSLSEGASGSSAGLLGLESSYAKHGADPALPSWKSLPDGSHGPRS